MNKILTNKKINDLNSLKDLLKNKKFTLVHGVFDVLHVGHKRHFETAKKLTGLLVVSLTSDKYVKKGPGRPYFNQFIRSEMVSSLETVNYVYINDNETPIDLTGQMADDIEKYGFESSISPSMSLLMFLGQALAVLSITLIFSLYSIFKIRSMNAINAMRE